MTDYKYNEATGEFTDRVTGRTLTFGLVAPSQDGLLTKQWWEFVDNPSFLRPRGSNICVGLQTEGDAHYLTWNIFPEFEIEAHEDDETPEDALPSWHSEGWMQIHRTRIFAYLSEYDDQQNPTRLIVLTGDYLPGLWVPHSEESINELLTTVGWDGTAHGMLWRKGSI